MGLNNEWRVREKILELRKLSISEPDKRGILYSYAERVCGINYSDTKKIIKAFPLI